MAKPKIFGSNAAYVPNYSRDKRRSKIPFQPSRQKKTKDRPKSGAENRGDQNERSAV